jgi:hypothetical protein
MAPGAELVVASSESPFAIAHLDFVGNPTSAVCPHCEASNTIGKLPRPTKKDVTLSLFIHPDWTRGEAAADESGEFYGGSADDPVEATIRWNNSRSTTCKLIEFRGDIPPEFRLRDGTTIKTGKLGGTVPGKSNFSCGKCGTVQDVLESVRSSRKTGPGATYAIQGYCPECDAAGEAYGGRFFSASNREVVSRYNAAMIEWEARKQKDLGKFWPRSELPYGFMTHKLNGGIPNHGFTHWWKMFNSRQLLTHSQILRAIVSRFDAAQAAEFVLGSFQQYLRNQCLFTIWNLAADKLEPMFANNNYHPKSTTVENCVFADFGRGNWRSQYGSLLNSIEWMKNPHELVHGGRIKAEHPTIGPFIAGSSEKVFCHDALLSHEVCGSSPSEDRLTCGSSTELGSLSTSTFDAVITDPPFGGLLHYSELSDFFYVWLRLALNDRYPEYFTADFTPKTMEAVANRARHPGSDEETGVSNADLFYQRVLTACWSEASRILKPSGILSFTFHHSEDEPWVAVLESLFESGFYLEATFPIRGDETKGGGEFGSRKIEYDIIHVCRKRDKEPIPISWAKLRRQVLEDVRGLRDLLEHHQADGLPDADLQVIRRGKALEYFSRHYGKVYKDEDTPMSVLEALVGINQLLDEEAGGLKEAPPHNAEPFTRMMLRLFDGRSDLPRDQMQKFLRGTGSAPSDFLDRGWVTENKKVFYPVSPLELAQRWMGKQRKGMTCDYDQAMFFIGACFENSGINASETLNNSNFTPHPALGGLLTWFKTHGAETVTRNAASIAVQLYRAWESRNQPKAAQLSLFDRLGEQD